MTEPHTVINVQPYIPIIDWAMHPSWFGPYDWAIDGE